MNKEDITNTLQKNHHQFIQYLNTLSKGDFERHGAEKWNAGQELDHILKSVQPLARALHNKAFIIDKFGESNRASILYDDFVTCYNSKLAEGGKATGQFIPETITWGDKEHILKQLQEQIESIKSAIQNYSEEELDNLQLPHPLLGLLTLREMLYFTSYHVLHHLKNSQDNLKISKRPNH